MTDLEEKMLAGVKETRIAREEVFKGSFLKVRCDTVTTATGVTRTREYIVHPGASVIVCLFDDQSVLMEYQWRQPCERAFWELPAGKLDPNEEPLVCAKRELAEETGYEATEWSYLGRIHNAIGYSDEHLEIYLAQGLTEGTSHLDEGECLSVVKMPLTRALQMIQTDEITDVKTIIGLLWAEQVVEGKKTPTPCP